MRGFMLLACGLAVSGCASVTRGWDEQVHINSNPPEAAARTSLGHACTTPCSIKIARKDEFTVTISKPGYVTEQIPVGIKMNGEGAVAGAGNILIGGLVGMTVDAVGKAGHDHCPNPVAVTLRRVGSNDPPYTPVC